MMMEQGNINGHDEEHTSHQGIERNLDTHVKREKNQRSAMIKTFINTQN